MPSAEYRKQWRLKHLDKARAYYRKWEAKNKDKRRALHRKHYRKHRARKIKERRSYYAKNHQKVIDCNRNWRHSHPEKTKLYRHNRMLWVEKGIVPEASLTPEAIKELWLFQDGLCGICEEDMSESEYTLDHIIPLSKRGHHAIYNIQLAHHRCNSMKQAKVSEADIQKTIMHWLRLKRYFFWRSNTGAMLSIYKGKSRFTRFGTPGAPDIFVVRKVKAREVNETEIWGIEVKAPHGSQSKDQRAFEAAFREAGGYYLVAKCLEDVTEVLG